MCVKFNQNKIQCVHWWYWRNMLACATLWLIGALWHRGGRCIRLWTHRQYLLAGSIHCWFWSGHVFAWLLSFKLFFFPWLPVRNGNAFKKSKTLHIKVSINIKITVVNAILNAKTLLPYYTHILYVSADEVCSATLSGCIHNAHSCVSVFIWMNHSYVQVFMCLCAWDCRVTGRIMALTPFVVLSDKWQFKG